MRRTVESHQARPDHVRNRRGHSHTVYGASQHSGHGTSHSHGDGCEAFTQCHVLSIWKMQQQTSFGRVVVVLATVVSVDVVEVVVVVLDVVVGVFRHLHEPRGRQTGARPVGQVRT
jgi:hypothetical protein